MLKLKDRFGNPIVEIKFVFLLPKFFLYFSIFSSPTLQCQRWKILKIEREADKDNFKRIKTLHNLHEWLLAASSDSNQDKGKYRNSAEKVLHKLYLADSSNDSKCDKREDCNKSTKIKFRSSTSAKNGATDQTEWDLLCLTLDLLSIWS